MKEKIFAASTIILLTASQTLLPATSCLAAEPAQSASRAAPEEWRQQPPKLPAPRSFKSPQIAKYKLANGLSVELVEDHRVPFTTLALGVKAGTAYDPPRQRGLSSLLAEMLGEGTEKRKSKEIAEAIDFIGGAWSSGAGADFTIASASALSQYNDRLLSTVSDVLINPSFPEDELKLKKTNVVQQLKMNRSKPDFLANERFAKVVFGSHPYSVVAPQPEAIEKITRQQLVDFHKQTYIPNDTYLVVVGDFKTDEMKNLIGKNFSSWKSGPAQKQQTAALPQQKGRQIYLVDRPDSVQSRIKVGNIGIKKTDPDFYALTVANQVLGGAGTARLFANLRENKGYTYGAYSKLLAQKEPGSLAAEAEVRSEVTAPALQEFLYELERMRTLKPSDKELDIAKNYLVGAFQLGLETQNGIAQRLLEAELYELPANYLETYGERITAVNGDEVRRVARKYLDLDNLVVTVVGDKSKIKSDLEYFAPVSVYDTGGAAMKATASDK